MKDPDVALHAELVKIAAKQVDGLSRAKVAKAVNAYFSVAMEHLKSGKGFRVHRFGTFTVDDSGNSLIKEPVFEGDTKIQTKFDPTPKLRSIVNS